MNFFLRMWESQLVVMMLWSLLCFCLGAMFTVTMYWYRINYVVTRAEKELGHLGHPQNRRRWRRRFNDTQPLETLKETVERRDSNDRRD